MAIRICVQSIPVTDQDHALKFYRDVLGYEVKHDEDMGNGDRWLTLVSPDDGDGPELLLEPNGDYPAMKALKTQLRKDGIPWTQLQVDDIDAEVTRMKDLGAHFIGDMQDTPQAKMATFDDTCGNTILLLEPKN